MKKGKIYAVGDIHGCYSRFLQMLEKINFSDEDQLYILGDAIDRGSEPLSVLKYIMERKNNIHLLMGNHEYFAKDILEKVNSPIDEIGEDFYYEPHVKKKYFLWTVINGGDTTFDQFYKLSIKEQKEIVSFLQGLPYYKKISVNGNTFFLVHAGIEKYTSDEELEQMPADNFIWHSPDFDTPVFKEENRFLIFGHTPSFRIQGGVAGRIFKKNNYIGIDCGAVFEHLGGKLGCICLNTMEEFYV